MLKDFRGLSTGNKIISATCLNIIAGVGLNYGFEIGFFILP